MFKHILVPLDGSELAESVLPAVASLASTLKARITLLHLIERDAPQEVHRDRHLTQADEAVNYLRAVAERDLHGLAADWHVHTAEIKDVAANIADHAEELKADLVVMCTHGRSGLRDILFGSIAQQVIAIGKTPVFLLRPGPPSEAKGFNLARILLPLDSESSHDEVFPCAKALAKAYNAEIAMVTVIPTFGTLTGEHAAESSLLPGTTIAMLDIKEQAAAEHLQTHVEELRQAGFSASASVARGDPATEIVKAAEKLTADMILLATHRKAGIDAFWAHSVSPDVARKTKLPLLLLPLD